MAGDFDCDGAVSAGDARSILRTAVALETVEAASRIMIACDIDLDGVLTAADARSALRLSVGLPA